MAGARARTYNYKHITGCLSRGPPVVFLFLRLGAGGFVVKGFWCSPVNDESAGGRSKNTKTTVCPLTFRIRRPLLRRKHDELQNPSTTNPSAPGRRNTNPTAGPLAFGVFSTMAAPKELRTPKSVDDESSGDRSKEYENHRAPADFSYFFDRSSAETITNTKILRRRILRRPVEETRTPPRAR